ncbi:C22orf23 [Branchiostoma lanceolatum]|uniref:C22orf23 protein n=1 Tax=Branchiostoma lanceolatum TaxID=7740 RepID=A0A8J9Z467_BRALA|nr:C22orf23 [Branchiostoma lanceolatum]
MAARQPVARGGMWNTQQPQYSKETQELLKVMMQESKLTNFQQRKLKETMKGGGTLPLNCPPTSSQRPQRPAAPVTPSKKVNPRTYLGRRSKESCESSPAAQPEDYRPRPKKAVCTDKEKERLGSLMAYGEEPPEVTPARMAELLSPEPTVEKDRFEELQAEIEERTEFLEEMERLGRGKNYRTIIRTEISQKIREMEIIDRKKTEQLKKQIELQQKQSDQRRHLAEQKETAGTSEL